MMRFVLFSAVVVNSLDLFATAIGIHWFGNREGNPLLAPVVQQSWLVFVLLKGALVPLLIVQLYRYRRDNPVLATAGMGIVTIALTVALGCWIGWMAAVLSVGHAIRF
jgi:uncharacterized membrane protein